MCLLQIIATDSRPSDDESVPCNAGPNANISFYIADPADPYWADTFGTIAAQMKSAGVDGLYIDQLAGYFPQPCFGRAGGDAAGTGWADGGRRLLSKVTEVLGPVRRSMSFFLHLDPFRL